MCALFRTSSPRTFEQLHNGVQYLNRRAQRTSAHLYVGTKGHNLFCYCSLPAANVLLTFLHDPHFLHFTKNPVTIKLKAVGSSGTSGQPQHTTM